MTLRDDTDVDDCVLSLWWEGPAKMLELRIYLAFHVTPQSRMYTTHGMHDALNLDNIEFF